MKRFNILLVFLFGIFSISAQTKSKEPLKKGTFYGAEFEANNFQDSDEVFEAFKALKASDSLNLKLQATVVEVCKAKGCWMKIDLPEGEQAMVRFKDYGFFMPLDIPNKEVILNGVAFVEEMSVDDQRHYAKDAGANEETLAKITKPKRTYSFLANGVLVPN